MFWRIVEREQQRRQLTNTKSDFGSGFVNMYASSFVRQWVSKLITTCDTQLARVVSKINDGERAAMLTRWG